MNQTELAIYKDLLEKEKERIEKSIESTITDLKEIGAPTGDQIDEAVALSQTALSLRFKERDKGLLAKVNLALHRIEDKTFGDCIDCGDSIGTKRLKIRPVTTLCILCKEIQEKQESNFVSN